MAQQKKEEALVTGRNVYLYNKRTIYYDRHTDTNYIIREGDVRAYNLLSIRHFMAFAFGYTTAVVFNNIWVGLVIGLAIWGGMSYYYYKKYLPSLGVDQGFKRPPTVSYTDSLAQRLSAGRLLASAIVSILLAVSLIANAFVSQFQTVVLVLN